MIDTTDIVIIGAGPIGIFTIFQAGMLNMSCHVIEAREVIGGQCKYLYADKPIYDIPGYPMITAADLIDKLQEQAQPFNPIYHCGRLAMQIDKREDDKFQVTMDNGAIIVCTAIIVAGGCGAFEPNKPLVENLEEFEGKGIHYMVSNKKYFSNKNIAIAGGGDAAVDWAIALVDIAKKIYLIHRRNKFRCHAKSEQDLYKLATENKIDMLIPYQLHSVDGQNNTLQSVTVKTLSGDDSQVLEIDDLLVFFGLQMYLGPIAHWGLTLHNKKLEVQQVNYRTNREGIYAIGDIAHYPGKLKLILSGFAEAATACHDIYKLVFPDNILHFEYSTNKSIPSTQ